MKFGCIINGGISDWQIFQQKDMKTDIHIHGELCFGDKIIKEARACLRIVLEDTCESITGWQDAELTEDNKWKITFFDVPAGGLYRIESFMPVLEQTEDGDVGLTYRGDYIHHIGVGDIYVITGQSNASGWAKGPVNDPPQMGVHIFKNSGKWDLATHPLNDFTNTLYTEHYEYLGALHTPFLQFAKMVKKHTNYPIGLIQTAKGGSAMSEWNLNEDGHLYKNMLEMIKAAGGKLRGMLWYQGCSDTCKWFADTYYKRFCEFVHFFRNDINMKDFPIITCQLNKYCTDSVEDSDYSWGMVREAQRQAARHINDLYIVPTLDLGLSDSIHTNAAANMVLGERLARMALNVIYGINIPCKAPDIAEITKEGAKSVNLYFDNVKNCFDMFITNPALIPFIANDEYGVLNIIKFNNTKNCIGLTFDRDIIGKCIISGASLMWNRTAIPVDIETQLPMLSFFEVGAN